MNFINSAIYPRITMKVYAVYTDPELTALLKEGDAHAFSEIYERYWNKMMAIAYNHTKDKSAAQEIVQELFVGIWNRKEIVEIQNLSSYLATAVKFSVYKQIARGRRRKEIEYIHYAPDAYGEEEQKIEAKFLQEYINGLVEQLPEKCRLVFNYSRVQNMTVSEIAQKMGISEKTVEGHLTKGLKNIRVNLKDSGILGLMIGTGIHEIFK